ncbi:Alpha/Beta hydrolase protein [Roridomyces roridus]|uniref:Alpha/Beta hydrolase protein n=1 Tax=Roridomyces roridus TaxID=1738132 RepID=A0AAD7FTJ0_9AGAR|nr:Alpha/Beta hydrolase protein [Roridomyces roridus]
MGFVDLHSSDDVRPHPSTTVLLRIHYVTNTAFGNAGGFDPDKPTVCILHPTFLDSSWLHAHFGDHRLDGEFNLIAFDMRVAGKSECRHSGKHDSWVDAADLAFAHQALALPPFHILALEGPSINCALRFAALFPEKCLSLALCNVPAPTEQKWIYTAYDELIQTWCFAEDLESYEHVTMEAVALTVGPNTHPDIRDDLISYWETTMHPRRRQRLLEQANILMNRTPLPSEAYQHITQPVLIIHGDSNEAAPRKYAERLAQDLKGVLYTVKGGGPYLSITPGTASIVNQVYVKFVTRLPPPVPPSSTPAPMPTTEERMRRALSRLEEITGNSALRSRDPLSSLSFSCLSEDIVKQQTEGLAAYSRGQTLAYLPLGPTGRPIRRYSERPQDDWFERKTDGVSYAGGRLFGEPAGRNKPYDTAEDSRVGRRGNFSPSVDKNLIKGSMAKVVSQPTVHKLFL